MLDLVPPQRTEMMRLSERLLRMIGSPAAVVASSSRMGESGSGRWC
jgi:hypothetical protein